MRKLIASILWITSIVSAIAFAGVPNVINWWELAKPYFIICFISAILAFAVTFPNRIRKITYPALVCISAWAYKHRVLMTRFTKSTYRVYKANHSSYSELFDYTQALFDIYAEGLKV